MIIRLIAIDRAFHSLVFTLLAIALFFLDTKYFDVESFAKDAGGRTIASATQLIRFQ